MAITQAVRILLVEDSLTDALLVRRWFKNSGLVHDLNVIRDGQEAFLHLIEDEPNQPSRYHLILFDKHLPGRNGDELLREVKARPKYWHVPAILFVEASVEDADWPSGAAVFCRPKPRDASGYDQLILFIRSLLPAERPESEPL